MKNYLAKRYARYYIQTADGRSYETTREKCFEPGETPTAGNPYKQRWFYDAENYGYIIRLPRNEQGETLYRLNAAYVKSDERYAARKTACVRKGTGNCDNDCENCQGKRYPRVVELDKPLASDSENDDEPRYFEIAVTDEYFADDEMLEGKKKGEALLAAVAKLSAEQQRLVGKVFFEGKSLTDIAREQGVDKSAISHRLKRIFKKLAKFLS
jgi:RNA polymerase sigma factor (sigma-70 family)